MCRYNFAHRNALGDYTVLQQFKWQQGNREYQTSPTLYNPTTLFAADRLHRLLPEIFRLLFALAWHMDDVIGDLIISFAATLQQLVQRKMAGQPPKFVHSLWGSAHHLIHGSAGPTESSSNRICWMVQPFCTAHCEMSHYFTMSHYVSPKNCPFHLGDRVYHLTRGT